ncbi:16437_t:CDS:1 [Funneliformis caledonium]|uniref:16437_t:CDS:1 n=1 Tax=Funneliformis caledonium TaxID=1117310 RepID=A0A9N9BA31_9GLOM|nr:16437_t:CDS:1 [Funneliformis caledonium]
MSYYCFETTKNHRLVNPYTPYGQPSYHHPSKTEIVEQIISETIDEATQLKIKKYTTLPLPELITPSVNVRTVKNPRPQNSFVIYRRNVQAEIAKEKGTNAAGRLDFVSKFAAKKWKQESQEVKELYGFLAVCAKKVHDYMYPGYVYQPKRQATTNEPMIMVHEPGIGGYKLRPTMQTIQTIPTPPQTPTPLSSPPARRAIRYDSSPTNNSSMVTSPHHTTQLPPLYHSPPMTNAPHPLPSLTSSSSFGNDRRLVRQSQRFLPPPTLDISDNAISTNFMANYDRSLCKEFDLYGRL